LGACPKSHTERQKTEFNAAKEADPSNPIFARFQMEYESNIFAFVDECDRRIRAAHRRLEKTPEENAKTTNLMREIAEIELAIQGGTEKIESFGEQGKVDESMREMAAIEALKSEKADKERDLQQLTDTSGASGHQKLRVCDVCGAYLSVLDSDRRLADHFGGKMHLGYHELRGMLSKFREERGSVKWPLLLPLRRFPLVSMALPCGPEVTEGATIDLLEGTITVIVTATEVMTDTVLQDTTIAGEIEIVHDLPDEGAFQASNRLSLRRRNLGVGHLQYVVRSPAREPIAFWLACLSVPHMSVTHAL